MRHVNAALFVAHEGCGHRCSFCNQRTISGQTKRLTPDDVRETALTAIKSGCDPDNSEIAFFGGSFTAIERGYMIQLLASAYNFVKDGYFRGIRCSTRPDAIDGEILDILKSYGVTSIELGAQSMSDRVLSLNERGHTSEDVRKSSRLVKNAGFELGLQMMTGLYGDDNETCFYTANEIINLRPKTVRIYPTTVLENTRLAQLWRADEYKPQSLEDAIDECCVLLKMFYNTGIDVIRLGLHSGGNVEDGYLAGAYHPAFREKCESRLYLNAILDIVKRENLSGGVLIYVPEREISKAIGQKRENVKKLAQMGIDAVVLGDKNAEKYTVRVVKAN